MESGNGIRIESFLAAIGEISPKTLIELDCSDYLKSRHAASNM